MERLARRGDWAGAAWPYLALFPKRLRDHALVRSTLLQLLPQPPHFSLHVLDLLEEFQQKSASLTARWT